MISLRDAALRYAEKGWSVFPCALNKRPLVRGGFHAATADADQVRRWWARWPSASLGAPVPPSMVVVDVDVQHDGLETLTKLQSEHGTLPVTLTCRTGSGGAHHYLRHPGGELRQTTGLLGVGLDTRVPGRGYVILPPSRHPSGQCYEWIEPLVDAAPMPAWLVALLRPPVRDPSPPSPGAVSRISRCHPAYLRAAITGEMAAVLGAPIGTRNAVLHRAAVKLGTFVGAGLLSVGEVLTLLLEASRASGYVASDGDWSARRTIQSGLAWGMRHPRAVPQ